MIIHAVDLAKARPGILVDELADLLNLDQASALELAERAVRVHGVTIVRSRYSA